MKRFAVWILLFTFAFIEGSFLALPFTLAFLLSLSVLRKQPWIFPLGFVGGLLLDVLTLNQIGERSLFFISFIFVIMLYERKFEIQTIPFVFFSSFFGSLFYLFLFHNNIFLLQALIGSIFAVIFFIIMMSFEIIKLKREM